MGKALQGKRIVITGSRKLAELSEIIERQGGEPMLRPQQGLMVLQEQEVEQDIIHLLEHGSGWLVFTTGTGLEALLQQADRIGVRDRLLDVIRSSRVAARGYKTFALLKQLGVQLAAVDEDGTTDGLVRALRDRDFTGQGVTIQLHGEPMPDLEAFFEKAGAAVRTIMPYRHVAPEAEVTERLCREIMEASVDAVCFTTAVQVRYFCAYAELHGYTSEIQAGFRDRVLAVAVGRVTAEALQEAGVTRVLMPENERMGAMIIELARYVQSGFLK
ncbi:uroporphyrinogen-III synthase [Paenibacillus filicis]|uniref:Uroporphyrinogen-III synthase n=1 Tax=Paenibacillus filicis TaxID=669464 RepID=A0ABU9DV67_9BACL